MYYKSKDLVTYRKLINESLEINPNDAGLVFNLGIVSNAENKLDEAEKYYLKAIELKPDFMDAYLNLSDLKLRPDPKLVEEINKLGESQKDLKRYEVLKAERQKLFNTAMPILEKAHELDDKNEAVKSNLMNIYKFLELNETEKYKALKAKM